MIQYSKNITDKNILEKLEKIRAKKIFDGRMMTEYFDFSNNELKKKGKILRLRIEGKKIELAFKEKKKFKGEINKTIIKNNIQVICNDYKKIRDILVNIGLKLVRKSIVQRKEYLINNVKLELNNNKDLEIESADKTKLIKIISLLK